MRRAKGSSESVDVARAKFEVEGVRRKATEKSTWFYALSDMFVFRHFTSVMVASCRYERGIGLTDCKCMDPRFSLDQIALDYAQ